MTPIITQILALWSAGSDTFEIATVLGMPEHEVYNQLARHRALRSATRRAS